MPKAVSCLYDKRIRFMTKGSCRIEGQRIGTVVKVLGLRSRREEVGQRW